MSSGSSGWLFLIFSHTTQAKVIFFLARGYRKENGITLVALAWLSSGASVSSADTVRGGVGVCYWVCELILAAKSVGVCVGVCWD